MRSHSADQVRELVSTFDVLARFGHAMDGGDEVRSNTCPFCGRGREIFGVNDHVWHCFRCHAKGDSIDLFRRLTGADDARFPDVLAAMGAAFGIEPGEISAEELAARRLEREERETARRERKAAQRRIAIDNVPSGWALARCRHGRGEDYLRKRGLVHLIGRDDVVRFDGDGNPCVLLYDFTGKPNNIVTRLIEPPPDGCKCLGRKHCPTLGTFGSVAEIGRTSGSVFVVEGVFDFLTAVACIAPHGNAVLGAHGADNLSEIVAAIAPGVARRGRRFCFISHEDHAGEAAVSAAISAAFAAGVDFDGELDLFNLGGAADLNDALQLEVGDAREYI